MKILHYISKINTFLLFICLFYFASKFTLGLLINLFWKNNIMFECMYIVLSIIIVKRFIKVSSPYEKFLKED